MAEEVNKEILEEIGEDVTEGTPTEGTTEGTPTEGTTGNGYLTKPYLVRNLQTFWGKIKQYITNQKFVNEDTVRGALFSKADQSDLDSLEDIVDGKVSQDELTEKLAGKVDVDGDKVLSDNNFTNVFRDKLKNLPDSVATITDPGFMSADDKQKLNGIASGATKVEVDSEWNPNSENPAQSKAISEFINGELVKKADKETDPIDPPDLENSKLIQGYVTDEGSIVLIFPQNTKHLKIYAPNSDRPIEKVSLKYGGNILFTNFQENGDDTLAITIENPEGKDGDAWNINEYASFNFYIESLIVENKKYKPFVLKALRNEENDLTKIELSVLKTF